MNLPIEAENEVTTILYGAQNILNFNLERFSKIKEKHDAFLGSAWPSVIFTVAQPIKTALINLNKKGIKQRLITEITPDNIEYCKGLMVFIDEVRHLDGIKGNFSVSDESEYVAISILQKEHDVEQLIFSNAKQIVEQHQYLFQTIWEKAIPAEEKIKEIEQGVKPEIIETIKDSFKIQNRYQNLIKSTTAEIMLIIPTDNAVYRQSKIGILQILKEIVNCKNNNTVNVMILAPLKNNTLSSLSPCRISLRNIEPASATKATIIIVDRRESFVIELKDDLKDTFDNAIGFATYSNSRATILSYISIFESFWQQAELIEKLKESEALQKDFIHIAAHELKTPIQPLLSLSGILQSKIKDNEYCKMLNIINRNAKKLKQLTNDILDITKIETKNFSLSKELFDLNELICDIVEDYRNQIDSRSISLSYTFDNYERSNDKTKLECSNDASRNTFPLLSSCKSSSLSIFADKNRLTQVISNLLDNAIRFTKHGCIEAIVKEGEDNKEIIIDVKDTGSGIDPEIFPRLFTKFATKSDKGTGLGLYISKNIIESHGGSMWAKNNEDGKGATFSFSLPVIDYSYE